MMLTTWIAIAVVLVAESSQGVSSASWWRRLGVTLGLSLAVALVYWLWQSGTLAFMARQSATDLQKVMDQVGRYANILGRYYFVILVVLLALAAFLLPPAGRLTGTPTVGYFVASAVALLVGVIIVFTNLRVIQADITFKIAEPFSRSGNWPAAIAIYNRANQLAPQEDYYYLFLGRAYLEHAKTLESLEERDRFIGEAEKDLLKAQELNPLNTDHTANLARLYSLWATFAQNKNSKDERGAASEGYFSKALILSPNSALLMIEWSNLYLNVMQQPEKAFEKIQQALEIDPQYHKSYGILADYYFRQARAQTDPALKQDALVQAEINYQKAMELPTIGEPAAKYSYALSLAGVYLQQNLPAKAVDTYLAALKLAPANADVWRVEEAIATLLSQTGDLPGAVQHLQTAIQRAPESELERLNGVLTQLQGGATPP
jgi:tetratricopeptide (TPR) repeat protein